MTTRAPAAARSAAMAVPIPVAAAVTSAVFTPREIAGPVTARRRAAPGRGNRVRPGSRRA